MSSEARYSTDFERMVVETVPTLPSRYAYIVMCKETKEAAIVDPGAAEPVEDCLKRMEAKPVCILSTHHHIDHCEGNEALASKHSLKVYAHKNDAERIPSVTDEVDDGDTVKFGQLTARVLYTPAHTYGHVCYRIGEAVFTGDTLLGGGANSHFEGNIDVLYRSVNETLGRLPRSTKVFFGREWTERYLEYAYNMCEPDNEALVKRLEEAKKLSKDNKPTTPSTIELELATNPFMRTDQRPIQQRMLGKYGPEDPIMAFSAMRRKLEKNWYKFTNPTENPLT